MHEHGLRDAGITEFTNENLKPFAESEIKSAITPEEIVDNLKTNTMYNNVRSNGNCIY